MSYLSETMDRQRMPFLEGISVVPGVQVSLPWDEVLHALLAVWCRQPEPWIHWVPSRMSWLVLGRQGLPVFPALPPARLTLAPGLLPSHLSCASPVSHPICDSRNRVFLPKYCFLRYSGEKGLAGDYMDN